MVNGVLTAVGDCNFIAHGNEFNFVPTLKAATDVWFNYRQTGGQPTDSSFIIKKYLFGNGADKELAYISDGYFSGNANTATKLQTARTINGTSFNGSANITTANWGTARTITVGNTGKSVNGSGNVSWSLGEIGVHVSNKEPAASDGKNGDVWIVYEG